jgi:hypothetical protein
MAHRVNPMMCEGYPRLRDASDQLYNSLQAERSLIQVSDRCVKVSMMDPKGI